MVKKNQVEELVREHFGFDDNFSIDKASIAINLESEEVLINATFSTRDNILPASDPDVPGTRRRGRKKKYNYTTKEKSTGVSISDRDVKIMRQYIQTAKWQGKLSDNQIFAFKETNGIRAKDLSIPQREQIRNIFEDLKKPLLQ